MIDDRGISWRTRRELGDLLIDGRRGLDHGKMACARHDLRFRLGHRARDRQQLATAYDRLVTRLLLVWCRFGALSFTEPAIVRFEHLRSLRLNVGLMDLRIAAVALENGRTVVTRNQRDFGRVPGLTSVDWSV